MAQLPQREWVNFSHRLIHHGRRVCAARKPRCDECVLNVVCPKIGVKEKTAAPGTAQPVPFPRKAIKPGENGPSLNPNRPETFGRRSRNTTMILSGHEIRKQLGENIVIDPFDERNLNPNSYNLTLHHELMTYEEVVLDMRKANRVRRIEIPKDGLMLSPNQLYLGRTIERTETHNFVPMIEGPLQRRPAGIVRARDRWFRRRGFLRLLDAGNVRRAAGANLSRRADLPDFLSPGMRRDHGISKRQISAQPRHSAQLAVQRAESGGTARSAA